MKLIKNTNYICYNKKTNKSFRIIEISRDVVYLKVPFTNRVKILVRHTTFNDDYVLHANSKLIE